MNNYDIFISYKRRGASKAIAPMIYNTLSSMGYDVFLDRKTLNSGHWEEQILECISNSKDIIILLEDGSLDSWFEDDRRKEGGEAPRYKQDVFIKEITHSLAQEEKNIIPILISGYKMPSEDDLPVEMKSLPSYQARELDECNLEQFCQSILAEDLTSKPQSLALSSQYKSKGGIIASFLFYSDGSDCDVSENGVRLFNLKSDHDELHPFIYNVSIAGEHRFHMFNNDTCEEMVIRQQIEPYCQLFVPTAWSEAPNLWELNDEIIGKQDDPETLSHWGQCLYQGTTKNRPDIHLALACLSRAIEKGSGSAREFMEDHSDFSIEVADKDELIRWYELSAECGSDNAQWELARMYAYGAGKEQSDEKAARYYIMAAEQGDLEAIEEMAYLYSAGKGVEKSEETAEQYRKRLFELRKADADHGHVSRELADMYYHGRGTERSYEKAAEYYAILAGEGDEIACERLAEMYGQGKGVAQSKEMSDHFYLKKASILEERTDSRSKERLADMYIKGLGVEQSYEKAFSVYEEAAQGSTSARFKLGEMYYKGLGTEQSYEKAAELFTKAAERAHPDAEIYLAGMYMNGLGVQADLEKSISLFGNKAKRGDKRAYNGLAWAYHLAGKYGEALPWAEKARESFPDKAHVLHTLATIHRGLGRYGEAMAEFRECLEMCKKGSYQAGVQMAEADIKSLGILMEQETGI